MQERRREVDVLIVGVSVQERRRRKRRLERQLELLCTGTWLAVACREGKRKNTMGAESRLGAIVGVVVKT